MIHTAPFFDMGAHHLLLMDHLEGVERGEIDRLMINMPPRHSKSELASKRFPAWALGRHPDWSFMICSYGQELANEISNDVRNQIKDDRYPFGIGLEEGRAGVKRWKIEGRRGGVIAAGIGGSVTGHGANVLIIDDPVKDRKQADSPTYRDNTWNWYRDTAYTRLMPGGAVILIMTRWHEGDLAGMLLEEMEKGSGDKWTILNLPAVAYKPDEYPAWSPAPDALGRSPGQALWPEWYNVERLSRIETVLAASEGPRGWTALYQQTPSTEEGLVFQRDWMGQRYRDHKQFSFDKVGIFVDSAYKEGVASAYSTAAVWGLSKSGMVLLDVVRQRVGYETLIQILKDVWFHWRDELDTIPFMCIEDKASGQSAIQTLQTTTVIPVLPFPQKDSAVEKKLATTSKEARADQATLPFQAGRIWLPQNAPWLKEWIREHTRFPTSQYNDQVDTTSMAVARLYNMTVAADISELTGSESYRRALGGKKGYKKSYHAPRGTKFPSESIDPDEEIGYNVRRTRLGM